VVEEKGEKKIRKYHVVTTAQGAAVHWQVRVHYYWWVYLQQQHWMREMQHLQFMQDPASESVSFKCLLCCMLYGPHGDRVSIWGTAIVVSFSHWMAPSTDQPLAAPSSNPSWLDVS
jgi:hypothetical protein